MISIHAPTRGATSCRLSLQLVPVFQSTLPREERHRLALFGYSITDFNPRSHERSDTPQRFYNYLIYISIHAPTRGATQKAVGSPDNLRFQSTLPREERPKCLYLPHTYKDISIHAPTRGATILLFLVKLTFGISIHAPTRGATFLALIIDSVLQIISIHAPTRGATFATPSSIFVSTDISIHAPTRGATIWDVCVQ